MDELKHQGVKFTRTTARVLSKVPMSTSEMNVIRKLAWDPKVQQALGTGSPEMAFEFILLNSKVETLPQGKRAILTPMTELALHQVRSLSEKFRTEMFTQLEYQLTDDQTSIVIAGAQSLAADRDVIQLVKNPDVKREVEKEIINIISSSASARYLAVEGLYILLNERAEQNPKHEYAKKIKEYGPKLKEILLDLYLNSRNQMEHKGRFNQLKIGNSDFSPRTKEVRRYYAAKLEPHLELINLESIEQFTSGKKLADLEPDQRIEVAARILEHPWRMVNSHLSCSFTSYEQESREGRAGVTLHTHPFVNGHIADTMNNIEWTERAWSVEALNQLWEKDKFKFLADRNLETISSELADLARVKEVFELGRDQGAEKIFELAKEADFPDGLRQSIEDLRQAEDREIYITLTIGITENLVTQTEQKRELYLRLQTDLSCADSLQEACEVIDRFGEIPNSYSIYNPSAGDRNTFDKIGVVNFGDGTNVQINFIANCFGCSTVTYDELLGATTVKRQGLHNDQLFLLDRRIGSDFSGTHIIIGGIRGVPDKESSQLVSDLGCAGVPLLIEEGSTGKLSLAFQIPPSLVEDPSFLQQKITHRKLLALKDLFGSRLKVSIRTSHGGKFEVLDLTGLGGLQPSVLARILKNSPNINSAKEIIGLWHWIGQINDQAKEEPYGDTMELRSKIVEQLIDRFPNNPEICEETINLVKKLRLDSLSKRNIYLILDEVIEKHLKEGNQDFKSVRNFIKQNIKMLAKAEIRNLKAQRKSFWWIK